MKPFLQPILKTKGQNEKGTQYLNNLKKKGGLGQIPEGVK